jgi:hypothetical protein
MYTNLWWVLVLLFVHLTSKLVSIFGCTFYHAFTPQLNTLFVNTFIHVSNVFLMHDIYVCIMYKPMNEQTSHDFHY